MGPRLVSRGNGPQLWQHKDGSLASMGPRLVSRGNNCDGTAGLAGLGPLQWGRGLLAAEILSIRGLRPGSPELQWGRGLLAAEIGLSICALSRLSRSPWIPV